MTLPLAVVVTTIQGPTPAMRALAERLVPLGAPLIIVGDEKGPAEYDLPGCQFLPLAEQIELEFDLPRALPRGHYTRKNVGYLSAIAQGAPLIYETDDDNAPNDHWTVRDAHPIANTAEAGSWCNVYGLFTDEYIWPRGFPLQNLHEDGAFVRRGAATRAFAPIQQGLADGAPDVDAVWRLVLDRDIRFDRAGSVRLGRGTTCPFNSQSTWWWPDTYELLYLPSHCTFRMTDIWRSFIAQRCLWELGGSVVFHAPEVEQVRNEHDLLVDFEDEVPGYLLNARLVEGLLALDLGAGIEHLPDNMLRCYESLISEGAIAASELSLLEAWFRDVEAARGRSEPG